MLGLLNLPDVPHVVFKHPPLAMALCQIQFSNVLDIADSTYVAPFHRAIRKEYPITVPVEQVAVQFSVGPAAPDIRQEARTRQWRFADPMDTWSVVLAQDFVALETRAYEDFEDFLTRLRRILQALVEHIQPALTTRIGLRYINEIRVDGRAWSAALRPELLGPLAVDAFAETAYQAVQELRLVFPPSEGVTVRHGLFPGGTTVQPRPGIETPTVPFYLLDFDAYQEAQPFQSLGIDPDELCTHVARYNRVVRRLFRWSLTEEYTEALGVRPNDRRSPPDTIVEEANQQAPHVIALEWIERATRLPLERVARLLGITRPTLYSWQQGAQIRSSNQQRLLAVLDVLKRAAARHPTPELLVAWLDTPRGADGHTPAQLLESGDMDRARLLAVSTLLPELLRAPAWTHEPVAEAFQGVTEHFAEAQAPDNDAELAALWDDGDDEDEPAQEIVFGE